MTEDNERLRERIMALEVKVEILEKRILLLVSRDEFLPIRAGFYGVAALVSSSIVAAILALVINRGR